MGRCSLLEQQYPPLLLQDSVVEGSRQLCFNFSLTGCVAEQVTPPHFSESVK